MTEKQQRILALFVIAMGVGLGSWWFLRVWTLHPNGMSIVSGKLPEWDFANLWSGGTLASQGKLATLFDAHAYQAWWQEQFGVAKEGSEWSYPPSLLLLAAPLSLLPIVWSYILWTLGGLAGVFAALKRNALPVTVGAAAVLSAGAFNNMFFGQTGALTAALLLGGLLAAGRRPILAGVLFGLLTIKPQMGLLVPICLIASGNWRAFVAAAATSLALIAASGLIFGWDAWVQFFTKTMPMMRAILEAPYPETYQRNGITVFLTARAAGAGLIVAYGAQFLAAGAAAALAWMVWRRNDVDAAVRAGFTACLSLLATPYAYSYDMVAYSAAVAILLWRADWRMSPYLIAAWLWPEFVAVTNDHFPVTPFIVGMTAWMAWRALAPGEAALSPQTAGTDRSPAT